MVCDQLILSVVKQKLHCQLLNITSKDNETALREIKEKLSKTHQRSVSLSTISRHLRDHGYRSVLPVNTPMLMAEQKQHRVEWAKTH